MTADDERTAARPADAWLSLDTLAASLQRYPETVLVVVGHTDSDATEEFNQRLSERRASAVAAYLQQQNVSAERMNTVGLGESSPVTPTIREKTSRKNGRVEIGIVPADAPSAS